MTFPPKILVLLAPFTAFFYSQKIVHLLHYISVLFGFICMFSLYFQLNLLKFFPFIDSKFAKRNSAFRKPIFPLLERNTVHKHF